MNDKPRRAAVYCRISKDKTGEGQGVERQQEACLALANARGWSVDPAHVFIENDTSAITGKRPKYDAMIAAAEAGTIDVIVAWHVDRVTRKVAELEDLIALSESTGVTIATVSGDLDLTTDAGRLVGRILASVARGEVERKSARQKAANAQRAEQGKQPHTGRAFGYNMDGTVRHDEAEAVRDTFAQFLTGAGTKVLADRLNERGFTNTRGNPWTRTGVRDMLRNPRYIAERWTLRTINGKRTREYVGPGQWEPIVDEATFRAGASILNDPKRKAAGSEGNARKFLGSGLFLCGVCGAPVKTAYGRVGKGNGVRYTYRKFQCPDGFCVSRRADHIESYVEEVIAERLRDHRLVEAAQIDHDVKAVQALRDESNGLRARLDSLAADLADGLLTARQVKVASDRLNERLADVEARMAELGSQSALGQVLSAHDPGAAWLALDNVVQRAAVVDALAQVRLMPAPRGRRPSENNPEKLAAWTEMIADTVVIEWREGAA